LTYPLVAPEREKVVNSRQGGTARAGKGSTVDEGAFRRAARSTTEPAELGGTDMSVALSICSRYLKMVAKECQRDMLAVRPLAVVTNRLDLSLWEA
jgi:hypothetical protein